MLRSCVSRTIWTIALKYNRVGKSRLKLNLYQPVAFINLSRFKPAYMNKKRLKSRTNERTIQAKSKLSIINTKMRMSQYHQFAYC